MRYVLATEAAKAQPNSLVHIDSEKVKHLRRVLRMEWGESVRVLDGNGRLFSASLEKLGETGALQLGALERSEAVPAPLELVVVLPKNATMDWLVEKAVECGVSSIVPVIGSRSVVKPDKNDDSKYVRRWQAIMDGAVEQSERLWRPQVCAPLAWEKFIGAPFEGKSFVFLSELRFEEQSDAEAMTQCWSQLQSAAGVPARLVIGPEGGFSDAERDQMRTSGFSSLSLGSTVLRVETAVIAALTLARASRLVSSSSLHQG